MKTVFVYGTLKRGGYLSLDNYPPGEARFISEAVTQGELRERGIPYFLPHGAELGGNLFAEGFQPVTEVSSFRHSCRLRAERQLPHLLTPQPWDGNCSSLVQGELWEVSEGLVERLDVIEGVVRDYAGKLLHAECHYLPVQVTVRTPFSVQTALAYSFNVLFPSQWEDLKPAIDGVYSSGD